MKAISIDRWNQICHEEVMWTLRTSGGTEGDDRTPIVAIVYETEDTDREEIL
jgi:hypothetical protein